MLGHKRSLNKFLKIEITQNILSNYNEMMLETNNEGKAEHSQICGK